MVLALALQREGYPVTLVSDQTPAEIAYGRIAWTQLLLPSARVVEQELGLDFWQDSCPLIDNVAVAVADNEGVLSNLGGPPATHLVGTVA
jgi:hypothetical protein